MENEAHGKEAAWVVLDEEGKIIVDHTYQGFDQSVQQQIKDYLNPSQLTAEPENQESWQSSGRKRAEIAKRYGKPTQQMAVAEDIERRRK